MGKKVLAFGTFDIFHQGHEFFLKSAKAQGGLLYIVVALDSTVTKVKGREPLNNQNARLAVLQTLEYVDVVMLGSEGDKYSIISDIDPDVIFLGYDQTAFVEGLAAGLIEKGITAKIVKFQKSFKPEVYKSSKLRPIQ